MASLALCREMENICRQYAEAPSPLQDRWAEERDAWNERVHKEIAHRFQGTETVTPS